MPLDKVRERITQWFNGEAGVGENEEATTFIADQFNNELTATGMLSIHFKQIQNGQPINLQHLFKQIMLLNQMTNIISELEKEFGQTQLTNFTGNQMSVKIEEQQGKSIGFLFGYIENMKQQSDRFVINEYQA